MDRRGFMYAPPTFGNGTFEGHRPALVQPAPAPAMGQQAEQPPVPQEKAPSRTGNELTVVVVLGLAVLAGLEAVGVTNILGRKPAKRGDSVWSPR